MTQYEKTQENTELNFSEFQQDAAKRIKAGQPLTGKGGILTPLIKKIVEASLEAELTQHMESCAEAQQENRRNGRNVKTVQSGHGPMVLETPRYRAGTFEPEIVKKRQTVLNEGLDEKILGLYSLGMSYQDIRKHMQEMYGTEVSQGLLSKVTDKLLPVISEWRNRVGSPNCVTLKSQLNF